MRPYGLLITGTDTGVGKTFVGCGLAAALRRREVRVAPFKPAETGCEVDPESAALLPADARLLRKAAQTGALLETICPYRFQTPVAPWVASEMEGIPIDPGRLQRCYHELASTHDMVLVETAGGILVPLAEKFHYADLARVLDLPVLLVAGSKLGVINHTLLTLEYLEAAGLPVVACVLNHVQPETDAAISSNEKALRRLLWKPLHVIPYCKDAAAAWESRPFAELAEQLLEAAKEAS